MERTSFEHSTLHDRLGVVVGDFSYRQIANFTNTHPESVRRYIQGHTPTVEFITAICQRFEINSDWLLTGRGTMRMSDIKIAVLHAAKPSDHFAAMAQCMESLTARVDRLEHVIRALEAHLRAPTSADNQLTEAKQETRLKSPAQTGARIDGIADAIARHTRPRDH